MFSPPRSLLENIEGELWREVDAINMKLSFNTNKLSRDQIQREIERGDKQYGQHSTSWRGEVLDVDWPTANLKKIDAITQTVTETKPDGSTKTTTTTTRPPMSITGLQSGAFKSLLAQMKQEIAAAQNQGIADVQAAKDSAANEIKTTIAGVKAKIQTEVSDALQEFAEFTNGGPA